MRLFLGHFLRFIIMILFFDKEEDVSKNKKNRIASRHTYKKMVQCS